MKSPSHLNDAMWRLAEAQDQAAIQEFIAKHPECEAELLSRVGMVQGLKGSKPSHKASKRFLPSPKTLSPEPNRLLSVGLVAFLVAAGVFATLGTLRFIESKNGQTTVVTPDQLRPIRAENGPGLTPHQPNPTINQPRPDENPVPPLQAVDPFERPVTIVAKNISLEAALNDIAVQAGITLESAPGMPEAMVEIDYRETPAMQVLEALGQTFGFTALRQGQSTALLIPARDPQGNPNPLPPGSVRQSPPTSSGGGLTPLPGLDPTESDQNRTIR